MALLDKLSKGVTDLGQKTKGFTEVSKLTFMISEQEKFISDKQLQIGKLYATIHKDDFEEEFSGMMSAIGEAEKRILDWKEQIKTIKGVVCCEKCGAELAAGAGFCTSCGTAVPRASTPTITSDYKCDNCGAPVTAEMKFCVSCGKPVDFKTLANRKTCRNCGAMIEDGMRFCTTCGAPVEQDEPVQGLEPDMQVDANTSVEEPALENTETKNSCPHCGAEMSEEMEFCTECGQKIRE